MNEDLIDDIKKRLPDDHHIAPFDIRDFTEEEIEQICFLGDLGLIWGTPPRDGATLFFAERLEWANGPIPFVAPLTEDEEERKMKYVGASWGPDGGLAIKKLQHWSVLAAFQAGIAYTRLTEGCNSLG